METVLFIIWLSFSLLAGYNLVLPLVLYVLFILRRRKSPASLPESEPDYAIIVTAYEQTHTLPAVVSSLLKLQYSRYMIYVVADKCDVSNLHFNSDKVILLRPEEPLQSNTRSHFYAINRFVRPHQYLTIIDSDNLVDPQYLNELNRQFAKGYDAVQGVRKAKNLDTVYAGVDAVQDIYYHFYDREVLFALGSSATLAGSGMAFTTELYRNCLEQLDITGAGFDKVLQIEILRRNKRIAFAKGAIVYDEKTSRSDQLVKQRARWFNTWFRYAHLGFGLLFRGLFRLNVNQFLFALLFVRPPLILVVGSSFLLMLAGFFFSLKAVLVWMLAFTCFLFALFIALQHSKADKRIYKAIVGIPLFMYYQVLSLLKVRKANSISVATQHYHNKTIDEVDA